MGETIRTFVAIALPDAVRDALGRLQEKLRGQGLSARWVRPGSVHLTLRFIGEMPSAEVEPVGRAMAAAADGCGPIHLQASGMGVFPGIRKARVLWVGLAGEVQALLGLQQRLEAELDDVGLAPEKRRFKAHLTLARFKGRVDPGRIAALLDRHSDFTAAPFRASELVLFESRLEPRGAVYTRILEIPLASQPTGPAPAEDNGRKK